jgi:hypothetical protein
MLALVSVILSAVNNVFFLLFDVTLVAKAQVHLVCLEIALSRMYVSLLTILT